jgi:CHAD domain-containing protein
MTRQSNLNIGDYAISQMDSLLTTLAFQLRRAAKTPGPDEIHDLRVSIRRFSQGLELFGVFFAKAETKRIQRTLKQVMQLTSSIRDRDIAMEFLDESQTSGHRPRLKKERSTYQRQFSALLRELIAAEFSAEWRTGLSLRAA